MSSMLAGDSLARQTIQSKVPKKHLPREERPNIMSTPGSRSWDEMIDTLRTAAGEVRSALGRVGSPSTDDDAAAARLKGDVSRLEQSASELISKISVGLRERRSEIDASFDRERGATQCRADEVVTGRTGDAGGA